MDLPDAPVSRSAIKLLAARAISVRSMAENVPSPCLSVCRMDAAGTLCIGCYRTLDEIALWSRADDATKRQIWAAIAQRLPPRTPTPATP
jgi:predicted Fe-S protein YdhL (DUF1289 family)